MIGTNDKTHTSNSIYRKQYYSDWKISTQNYYQVHDEIHNEFWTSYRHGYVLTEKGNKARRLLHKFKLLPQDVQDSRNIFRKWTQTHNITDLEQAFKAYRIYSRSRKLNCSLDQDTITVVKLLTGHDKFDMDNLVKFMKGNFFLETCVPSTCDYIIMDKFITFTSMVKYQGYIRSRNCRFRDRFWRNKALSHRRKRYKLKTSMRNIGKKKLFPVIDYGDHQSL